MVYALNTSFVILKVTGSIGLDITYLKCYTKPQVQIKAAELPNKTVN